MVFNFDFEYIFTDQAVIKMADVILQNIFWYHMSYYLQHNAYAA